MSIRLSHLRRGKDSEPYIFVFLCKESPKSDKKSVPSQLPQRPREFTQPV